MAKKSTPDSSAPSKPVYDPVAEYEEKLASPPKPAIRLPRLGCFWIFFIFLFLAGGLTTGYYHSMGEVPTSFTAPDGRVSVSDPEGVLLEEDQKKLEVLAGEISKIADCGVAVMFIDERFASPIDVFEQIAAEWEPGKGVLLVQDVRGTSVRFGLIGGGWRLADWDPAAVTPTAARMASIISCVKYISDTLRNHFGCMFEISVSGAPAFRFPIISGVCHALI